jgi:hypothetical protein
MPAPPRRTFGQRFLPVTHPVSAARLQPLPDPACGVRRTGNEPDRRRFRDLQERTLQSIYKRTVQSD